jgi:hypothetical protein
MAVAATRSDTEETPMTPYRHVLALVLTLLIVAARAFTTAAQPATTLEGTVASSTAASAVVTTEKGQITVILTPKTRVTRRLPASIADIKVGSFLGVTATKQANGTLLAVSVSILDAFRDVARARQYPMTSGNIMTNAPVTAIVVRKTGRSVKMDYQNHSAFVFIPETIPIRRVVPAKPADITAGAHVIVRGEADGGHITAASISIQ